MAVKNTTAGAPVEIVAGQMDDGRVLAVRVRRPTELEIAEYGAGMSLSTPVEVQVDAAMRARGLTEDAPPPVEPEPLGADATPEESDAYVAAMDAYGRARLEWEREMIPKIVLRERLANSREGSKDRERKWRAEAALVCASITHTRIGDDPWEAETFGLHAIEEEVEGGPTSIHRLPYGAVRGLAVLIHGWITGGEVGRRRIATFRPRARTAIPAGPTGESVRGATE